MTVIEAMNNKRNKGQIVVYTDGSAFYGNWLTLRRTGWGVYYGKNHPNNRSGQVCTRGQTAFRGELRAAAHVRMTAHRPTEIVTDCKAVADGIKHMMEQHTNGVESTAPKLNNDIWQHICNIITKRPTNHFDIRWTKAHLTGEEAERAS